MISGDSNLGYVGPLGLDFHVLTAAADEAPDFFVFFGDTIYADSGVLPGGASAVTLDEYRELFLRMCRNRKIPYDEQGLIYLVREYYQKRHNELRACHPRDILDQILDIARYLGVPPRMTPELIAPAADAYFVEL